MKINCFSVKKLCLIIEAWALLTAALLITVLYIISHQPLVVIAGILLAICFSFWMFLLIYFFGRRLSIFTSELCYILDNMISGREQKEYSLDEETLFARIYHRLTRLYSVMQKNQRKVDKQRKELQVLVSHISHQVRTPVSNLKMVTDTLLTKTVSNKERKEFLKGIKVQVDKLDFLMEALVKTSRLETGAIKLQKKDAIFYETLTLALSSIVYSAENKYIDVTVDCPEDLYFSHDSKWTAEALFNLLDNAVKYTPVGGKISISVKQWEMYVKVDVSDTGKGIPENHQASIFQRFYREEEVHNKPGVGIGLYLARQIITQQGGYIKVVSEVGKGSTFSVFLPIR